MNLSLILAIFAIIFVAAQCSLEKDVDRLDIAELKLELAQHKAHDILQELHHDIKQLKKHAGKHRKPRAICGTRLLIHARNVCGGSLDESPGTNVDMSIVCCTGQVEDCTNDYIKKSVCPSKIAA